MKLMCWNVQGMGSSLTFHHLKELLRLHSPEILFLIETKAPGERMEMLKEQLRMDHSVSVDAEGLAGGLCLLRKAFVNLQVSSVSNNLISAIITSGDGLPWMFSGIYASTNDRLRDEFWKDLIQDMSNLNQPLRGALMIFFKLRKVGRAY